MEPYIYIYIYIYIYPELEPYHQMQFSVKRRTIPFLGRRGEFSSTNKANAFSIKF